VIKGIYFEYKVQFWVWNDQCMTEFNNKFGHIFKKAEDYKEADDVIDESEIKNEEDGEMLSDSEVQDPSEKVLPLTNKDAD